MEIEELTKEEIIAKDFKPISTDNGTYYTHDTSDSTFVAIDDRAEHRDVWGYRDGKRMQKDEAERHINRIFDKEAKGETFISKRTKIAWNEIALEFLQMQQDKAKDDLLVLSIQDDYVEIGNTKGAHYKVLIEDGEVVGCPCDDWYYKASPVHPCKHMIRAQMAIGPEKLVRDAHTIEIMEEKAEAIVPVEIMNAEKGTLVLSEKDSPKDVIEKVHVIAKALMDIVEAQRLYAVIKGKKFLRLEAWQTLGTLCKLSGMCTRTAYLEIDGVKGWDAQAIVVNSKGQIISSGEAICMNDEENWKGKPMYQLKSMAQTRALSKAYRITLSFIVVLAGYEACPFEEIEGVKGQDLR